MASVKKLAPIIDAPDITRMYRSMKETSTNVVVETRIQTQQAIQQIDPYTEEIIYSAQPLWYSAEGIVGSVTEDDALFGFDGRVKAGMLKISYPYQAISGVLHYEIKQISASSKAISGLYYPVGKVVDTIGETPMFVDFALIPSQTDG